MLVDNITDLRIFSQVVKEGSLSAAGRELGFSSAVMSKRLQRLEEQLGIRLINRSTRKLSITEEGARFLEYCIRILAELEEAESAISHDGCPKGTLRVTVPAAFGRLHIAPLVPKFLSRYPELKLTLHLTDSIVDIINDGYDVAVRIGELKESNIISRHLGVDQRLLVATPSYIKKHGAPKKPADLKNHNALLFSNPNPMDQWRFIDKAGVEHTIKVSGNFDTNNCDALRESILADAGIALRPSWDVWQDVLDGALIVLLPEYIHPSINIQALYPSRRHLSQKVRVFIDFLCEAIGETPYWDISSLQGTRKTIR